MDEELFELCKQVYENTGWKCGEPYLKDHVFSMYKEEDVLCYLYNSDYLLEKLPIGARIQKDSVMMGEKQFYMASMVYFKGTPKEHMLNCGDTISPLKALLKLTLALAEAGELPKEEA